MALLKTLRISAIPLIGLLTACGGGDSGGTDPGNERFIGDFMPDVSCEADQLKILDADYQINGVNVFNFSNQGGLQFGSDTVLESACYLTLEQLEIPAGAQLTINPNTIIMFGNRTAGLTVLGGNIIADGTAKAPIYFTGEGSNPLKWAGIRVLRRNASENIFDYTVIEHAGSGHYAFTNAGFSVAHHINDRDQVKGRITFTNNVIRDTGSQSQFPSYAFLAQHHSFFNEISNNTIYRNPINPISITVNEVHFIDSTNKFEYAGVGNLKNKIIITNSLLQFNVDETLDTSISPEANYTSDVTWKKQPIPYLLEDDIQISHTTLNIEPGAELQFLENAGIRVVGNDASLSAIGTSNEVITFTKDDTLLTNSWSGIIFNNSNSSRNNLNYTQIEFGGSRNLMKANLILDNFSQVSVNNTRLQHSQDGYGVIVDRTSRFKDFSDNVLSFNTAGAGLVAIQALNSLDISSDYRGNFNDYLEVDTSDNSGGTSATMPGINTPYAFLDNFYVNRGLTINPGATLLFAGGKSMEIRSNTLFAIGAPGNPILFASLDPLLGSGPYWGGLLFNSSSGSELQFVTVSDAGFRVDGAANNGQAGIRIISNSQATSIVTIDNTTVTNVASGAHGIFVDINSTMVSKNLASNNIENSICRESDGDLCR